MKKSISLFLAILTLLFALCLCTPAFADNHDSGWAYEDGGWMYYDDGAPYCNGIFNIEGKSYYFNHQGIMQTGWIYEEGTCIDRETGEQGSFIIWYYAESNGVLVQGWKYIGNLWYYFEPGTFYMLSGGMRNIGGKDYYFKSSGAMATGWIRNVEQHGMIVYDHWYYAEQNGVLQTEWKYIGGSWYYFDPNAYYMYCNFSDVIGGKLYFFTSSGAMLDNGWGKDIFGYWYYAQKGGVLKTGWLNDGGVWYYLDKAEGYMYTGGCEIDGKLQLFDLSGAWIKPSGTGWKSISYSYSYNGKAYNHTEWYYIKNSAVATGWQLIGGRWYYLSPSSGKMYVGAYEINGKLYFFEAGGALKNTEGWAKESYVDGTYDWCYVYADGTCARGWVQAGGSWYYLDKWGYMLTDFNYINGNWYYFDNSGAMATGSRTINGKPYVFDGNGVLISGEVPESAG